MISTVIVVPELTVHVVTGDTCYRYENGFSAIYAEVVTDDPTLADQLRHAAEGGGVVTLRCAMLDVAGLLRVRREDGGGETFVVPVEDLTYRKPREL